MRCLRSQSGRRRGWNRSRRPAGPSGASDSRFGPEPRWTGGQPQPSRCPSQHLRASKKGPHRCADQRFPRSLRTVRGEVRRSQGARSCRVLACRTVHLITLVTSTSQQDGAARQLNGAAAPDGGPSRRSPDPWPPSRPNDVRSPRSGGSEEEKQRTPKRRRQSTSMSRPTSIG
jgi:hypothetical protein